MGCEIINDSTAGLAAGYRSEFPVTENLIYLNNAAVAPLCRRSVDAMRHLADDCSRFGGHHYDAWLEAYDSFRQAGARLIHAEPSEIAIAKNTSEGVSTVALGLNWRPGDRIVGFREEFPANYFPWARLESRGVRVEWLSVFDPPEKIEKAAKGARLLAISFVQFLSGYRCDLETIGEICKRHNVFFFCDAIQGLGAFPLDVRKAGIHALAADGHKWLVGPEGCAILYIRKDVQDQIEPVEFGWMNVARQGDYVSRDPTLRQDAGRYECGTLNTIGCYGLRASMEFLLEVGIDRIGPYVASLADRLAEGATAKGYELLGHRTPATGAGIVSIRKASIDPRMVVHKLKEEGIAAAPRSGWTRLSPHFYVSPDEIEKVIDLLP